MLAVASECCGLLEEYDERGNAFLCAENGGEPDVSRDFS